MTDPTAGCLPPFGGSGIYKDSMAFPLGLWQGIANGRNFVLDITSVDSDGKVKGVYDAAPIQFGLWITAEHKLTFHRVIPDVLGDGRALVQHFQGYLMAYDEKIETKWRLAGIFIGAVDDPPPKGKHAGWYATLSKKQSYSKLQS